jgi:hypothetical protein
VPALNPKLEQIWGMGFVAMHPEQIASIVFVVILIVWAAEHIAVSALHAAARIRDTKRQLFPPKKPPTSLGPRIVESRDLSAKIEA